MRLAAVVAVVAVVYCAWHVSPVGDWWRRHTRRDRRRMSVGKRWLVWALALGRCHYCRCLVKPGRAWGRVRGLQVDHWQPWSAGGSDWLPNLRASCTACNRSKGATPGPVYVDRLTSRM